MTNIMKTLNIYKNTTLALMALTMGLSLVGCAEDSELIYQGAQQLSVKPLILDNKVSRATASEAKLNEDKLYNFNIKMFGEYNECKVDKTFTGGLQSGKEEVIDQNNWKVKNDLQEGNTYSVKSVANATGSGDVQTDVDIWKPYDATSNSSKMFLMSSIQDYEVTKKPTQTIPVNLARAAAKIVLTVHVDVKGYTAGQVKWQLMNYNAKTTIFGSNTESELKDGEMVEAQGESDVYTVTTYSYATQWDDDDTNAPAIYLEVLLTADGKTEMNYYKIPVRDPNATGEDAKKLNRNTIYTIDAKINNKGGSSEIGYITAGKVVYDVLPWSDGGTTNIDANTSYLMVTPKVVYMKNVDTDMSVTYKSSSPVTIVSKKVYYIDNEGNTVVYSEGDVETFYETTTEEEWVEGHYEGWYWVEGHYVKKEVKKEIGQLKPYPTKMELQNETDNLGGKIVINSPIPKNRFSKYIVLTLENAEGKQATVKYKQSPLIETQNFFGDYSSRSEDGWAYRTAAGKNVNNKYTYDHGGAYLAKYYDTGSGNIYSFYYGSWNDLSLTNNRMYIIQVSSTKDSKYNIAHPNINQATGYTNDEVVSPAFMIASQLGAVQSENFDQSGAKTHCETYREVKKENGIQVEYDGWRLPTKTEIQFIVDFQKESYKHNASSEFKKPIKPVLEGANYYTLNNETVATGVESGDDAYVRCVRDLTPEEVEELDKQMK